MAAAKQDTKPSKDFTSITQVGLKAHQLAVQYQANLGARLDPKLLPTLANNLASLGIVVPAVKTVRDGSIQSTAAQSSALLTGYLLVTAARTAVARKQPDRDVKLAYGVGNRTNKLVVKDVKTALQKIIDRATAQPKEAAGFSIIKADVDTMTKQLDAIDVADKAQETARATAPLSTKERNKTARQILDAVDTIAGAGLLAFATSATERASFEALIKKGK